MKNENLLLLHFGLPKTGTTSLQSFLKLNKKKLHELGWCYPDLNKEYYLHEEYPEQEKNGYLLDFFYMNSWENESRELWAIIKRKLKTSNVIISEER